MRFDGSGSSSSQKGLGLRSCTFFSSEEDGGRVREVGSFFSGTSTFPLAGSRSKEGRGLPGRAARAPRRPWGCPPRAGWCPAPAPRGHRGALRHGVDGHPSLSRGHLCRLGRDDRRRRLMRGRRGLGWRRHREQAAAPYQAPSARRTLPPPQSAERLRPPPISVADVPRAARRPWERAPPHPRQEREPGEPPPARRELALSQAQAVARKQPRPPGSAARDAVRWGSASSPARRRAMEGRA